MNTALLYLTALAHMGLGAYLKSKRPNTPLQVWFIGAVGAIVIAVVCHVSAIYGMTRDVETWSGQIDKAVHYPAWTEKYYVTKEHSSGTGRDRKTWTTREARYRNHPEHWTAFTSTDDAHEIDEGFFNTIVAKFGSLEESTLGKPGFYSGDRRVFTSSNSTGYIFPTTALRTFSNRVKAAPSLFSYSPPDPKALVYPWPGTEDWTKSGRLLGTASELFDLYAFDVVNSRLGPVKKVNVILVGWRAEPMSVSHEQEAAWCGGKKNDLVLCFGGLSKDRPAKWARVFGWTDSDLCKRELETALLTHPAGTALLGEIERIIRVRYKIKDWSHFDYIAIPVSWPWVLTCLVVSAIWQFLLYHERKFRKRTNSFGRFR